MRWVYLFLLILCFLLFNVDGTVVMFCVAATIVIWIVAVYRASRVLPGLHGLFLSLLAHTVLLGYLIGLVIFVAAIGALISIIIDVLDGVGSISPQRIVVAFALLITGGFIIWLSRRGERFIAQYCIHQCLRRTPSS